MIEQELADCVMRTETALNRATAIAYHYVRADSTTNSAILITSAYDAIAKGHSRQPLIVSQATRLRELARTGDRERCFDTDLTYLTHIEEQLEKTGSVALNRFGAHDVIDPFESIHIAYTLLRDSGAIIGDVRYYNVELYRELNFRG